MSDRSKGVINVASFHPHYRIANIGCHELVDNLRLGLSTNVVKVVQVPWLLGWY